MHPLHPPTPTPAFSSWWTDQTTDRICQTESEFVAALYGHYFVKGTTPNVCVHTHRHTHKHTHETLFNYDVCRCSKPNIVTNNKKGVLWRYNTRNTIRTNLHGQHPGSLTPLILLAVWMLQFMKSIHCTEHNSWHLFKECEKSQSP